MPFSIIDYLNKQARKAKQAGVVEPYPEDNMSDGYYEAYFNPDVDHDPFNPVYYLGSRHFPIEIPDTPQRPNNATPSNPSNFPPPQPQYQPAEMPQHLPTVYIPTNPQQWENFTFPSTQAFVQPTETPYYPEYLPNNQPSAEWIKYLADQEAWNAESSTLSNTNSQTTQTTQEINSQPTPNEGPSRKPKMRVMAPSDIFEKLTIDTTQPMEEEEEEPMEEDDPTEESEPEEEDPSEKEESENEDEENLSKEAVEEEPPTNPIGMSSPIYGALTSREQSYGSMDPYVQYLEELRNQAQSSFPPFQGQVPSIQEQADEIREQNRVADYLYLSANGNFVEYPEPRNHYEMVTLGYRDPPPQYGYPNIIPQSYEEHLDRALRESDEWRKKAVEEEKEKKTLSETLLRKCNKLSRVIKKIAKKK